MEKKELSLRNYAHLGDAVWEIFVREYVISKTSNPKKLHTMTTDRVNATFQKDMLNLIIPDLSDDENELVRRARNLPIPVARRHIQAEYRMATAFEVLIGYFYLHCPDRLEQIYQIIRTTEFFN